MRVLPLRGTRPLCVLSVLAADHLPHLSRISSSGHTLTNSATCFRPALTSMISATWRLGSNGRPGLSRRTRERPHERRALRTAPGEHRPPSPARGWRALRRSPPGPRGCPGPPTDRRPRRGWSMFFARRERFCAALYRDSSAAPSSCDGSSACIPFSNWALALSQSRKAWRAVDSSGRFAVEILLGFPKRLTGVADLLRDSAGRPGRTPGRSQSQRQKEAGIGVLVSVIRGRPPEVVYNAGTRSRLGEV